MANVMKTLTESLNLTQTGLEELRNVMGVSNLKFNALIKVVSLLSTGIREANALQRKTLAVNTTIKNLTGENTKALNNLWGGFQANSESLLELKRAGFDKLNPATTQLATFMKNTGQSTQGLVKLNQLLYNQGGMTENAINSLSEDLAYTSQQYKISSEDLISAMGHLQKNMGTYGQLGIAGPLSKAVSDLAGKMGSQFKDSIGLFADQLASTKTSSTLLSKLGLFDLASDIRGGKNVTDKALLDAIRQSARASQQIMNLDGSESGEVFESLLSQVGGQGGLGQLGLALDKADIAPEGPAVLLSNQMNELGLLVSEIWEPLQMLALELLPPIIKIMKDSMVWLKRITLVVVPALTFAISVLVQRMIWSAANALSLHIQTGFSRGALMGALGRLTGAVQADAFSRKAQGAGSIIGLLVSLAATGYMTYQMSKRAADIQENSAKLAKDKFLDEQRRQQTDAVVTNSYMALAKALTRDAGVGVGFMPGLMQSDEVDNFARMVGGYLHTIAATGITATTPTIVTIGGTP